MARPGVRYLDVAQAATQLMEQDIRPSIEEVRKLLGTGSNSTINRHLRVWREKQGNQIELEQGLPESLLIAIKGIYNAIKEDGEHKINIIKTETNQSIAALENKLSELNILYTQSTQENHSLQSVLNQSQEEKSALQRRLNTLENDLDKKTDENNLLKERIIDKKSEIERVEQQLKYAQNNLDHYRESTRKERAADTVRFENSISKLESELQAHREIVSKLKEEISSLLGQNKLLKHDKEANLQKLSQTQLEYNECASKLQGLVSELLILNKKHDALIKENNHIIDVSNSEKNTINSLQLSLKNTEGRLEEKNVALNKAEDNVENFCNKNMFLVQQNTELSTQLKQLQTEST